MRNRGWVIVGLTLLFVFCVRLRLREMPLERDEGEYAYAGQLMLQGVPPYKEAYNMKLPGTYAAYALMMAVFGQTPSGIHFGLALVNAGCIVLMFLIGRKLLDETAGIAAAVAFALMALSPSVLGLAAHATHFVILAALGGILCFLHALEKQRPIHYFLTGSFFGLAFLMKQHGIFFGVFGVLYLLGMKVIDEMNDTPEKRRGRRGSSTRRRPAVIARTEGIGPESVVEPGLSPASSSARPTMEDSGIPSWRAIFRQAGLLVLGLVLPYLVTILVLWATGVLPQFIFWTITYARRYATAIPLVNGLDVLRAGLRAGVGPGLLFWLLPAVGALLMWWEQRLSIQRRFFLTALAFCSAASVSIGFFFREHYFILLLPILALLGAVAVSRGFHLLKHDKTIELFLAVPILGLFLFALGGVLLENGPLWFHLSSTDAVVDIYESTIFSRAVDVADYLKSHTTSGTRVAVIGSEPEIYFYSHRPSGTGYIYTYPLMEIHPYALKMQEEMIGEIERARPEYVVYVEDDASWFVKPDSQRRIYDWWQAYWGAHLELVSTVSIEVKAPDASNPGVDKASASHAEPPGKPKNMLILKTREKTANTRGPTPK